MKKRFHWMLALAAALCVGLSPVQAQEIKGRLGHGLADDHSQGKASRLFSELVEKNSQGRIKIQVVANQALGPDPQMIAAVQGGVQQFYAGSPLPLIGQVKEIGFQDVPFLFSTAEEAQTLYDGEVGQYMNKKLAEKGFVVLGWWENGFRHFTNSKHPIRTVADFQGLKFRTQPNPMAVDAFKAMGLNAAPLPWSELFVALESKAFDGQENALPLMYSQRFYEVQKHLTLSAHMYNPLIFVASKKFWDGLSEQDQKIMTSAAQEATKYQRQLSEEDTKKALQGMKDKGMQVVEMSEADKKVIRERVAPVIVKHEDKLGPEFMKLVHRELDTLRKKQ